MDVVVSNNPERVLHVVQGAVGVTDDPGIIYTGLIGSCVLVCLNDPVAAVGGMAHFVFPNSGNDARFGAVAIAALLHQMLTRGGQATRLQAKLFGGAMVHEGWQDIGKSNAEFAISQLAALGVQIVAQDLGGQVVRRVRFCPSTGAATVTAQDPALPQEAFS